MPAVRLMLFIHRGVLRVCMQQDIDEALRLMRQSKQSLHDVVKGGRSDTEPISAIFNVLRSHQLGGGPGSIPWDELTRLLPRFSVRGPHSSQPASQPASPPGRPWLGSAACCARPWPHPGAARLQGLHLTA